MSVSPTTNIELFQRVPAQVRAALRTASDRSGVDFSYLLANAALESGFRADAKAVTSSATGLF
jgi:soluble lytic murein transglycosylase-like protein